MKYFDNDFVKLTGKLGCYFINRYIEENGTDFKGKFWKAWKIRNDSFVNHKIFTLTYIQTKVATLKYRLITITIVLSSWWNWYLIDTIWYFDDLIVIDTFRYLQIAIYIDTFNITTISWTFKSVYFIPFARFFN